MNANKIGYTKTEAQEAIGIKQTKLDELIAAGALDARKIGKRVIITADSIREYMTALPKADVRLPAAMRRNATRSSAAHAS